jgi:hypothetical protein
MQKSNKKLRRMTSFTLLWQIGLFSIGFLLLTFTGPTQLDCTRNAEAVNCSVNGRSVFGFVKRVEIPSIEVKTVRLDTQVTIDRIVSSDGTSAERSISAYAVQLVGNPTTIFGDYSSNQESQQSKVDQIALFLSNKSQSSFELLSKDYRLNIFGILMIVAAVVSRFLFR